ncbi:hypothetical protein G6F62_015255 [Rhizopus arrhizus]|nr:hypothetical protein G6F62_015255 [Rhizopus arrhizus]
MHVAQPQCLQFRQRLGQRQVQVVQQPLPALARGAQQFQRLTRAFGQHFGAGGVDIGVVRLAHRQRRAQVRIQRAQQLQRVAAESRRLR